MQHRMNVPRFLGINSSLLRLELLSGFLTSFFSLFKMLFMNRLEFSFFANFFVCIFEYDFL